MDSESEKIVQQALDSIMADSKLITVVIAHRLSTIRGANKICYVDHGKVREVGTYEELMANPHGHYRRLESLQTMDEAMDRKSILTSKALYDAMDKAETEFSPKRDTTADNDKSKENTKGKNAKDNYKKAKDLAKDEYYLFIIGSIGALLNGIM